MRSAPVLSWFVASAAASYLHDPRILMKKQDVTGNCGAAAGGSVCADGQCCSEYGWCGTGSEYCAAPGCQQDYSGVACDAAITPPGESTKSIPRPHFGSIPYGSIITDCTIPGKMALTFDDGPYIYTATLLDILAANNVKATFYINANNGGKSPIYESATDYPGLLQNMLNAGHHIASHSWSHADLNLATAEELDDEIIKNEMAFNLIFGFIPTYFRPPYGNCNAACISALDSYGYHITNWNLDTLDWKYGPVGGAENFDAAVSPSNPLTDSFICLAHDIHESTVTQLALHMITAAKDAGYDLVTVGECLGDPMSNWYRNPTDGGPWMGVSPTTTASRTSTAAGTISTSTSSETPDSTSVEPTTDKPTSSATSTIDEPPTTDTHKPTTDTHEPTTTDTHEPTTTDTHKPTTDTHEPTTTDTHEPTTTDTHEPTTTDTHKPTTTPHEPSTSDHIDYTPAPTAVTTVCSNWQTTITLTYTSTYCPRPTAPPGAGRFGAPDSEGIYSEGWVSPNRTSTTAWLYPASSPASGNGGGGPEGTGSAVSVSGAGRIAGSLFAALASAGYAYYLSIM